MFYGMWERITFLFPQRRSCVLYFKMEIKMSKFKKNYSKAMCVLGWGIRVGEVKYTSNTP